MKELRTNLSRPRPSRRGSALLFVLVLVVAAGGLSVSMLTMNLSSARAEKRARDGLRAFYAAEAALNHAMYDLEHGGTGVVGTSGAPQALAGATYFVETEDLDSTHTALRSTARAGRTRARMELVVRREPTGYFEHAAFGDDGLVLNSNSFTDSWDPEDGDYASQVVGGTTHASTDGDVGSNADVIVLEANTEVWGDATPGPSGIVQDDAPQTQVYGSTAPAPEPYPLPPIDVPDIAATGSISTSGVAVLGPGDVHKTSISMSNGGVLTIVGPTRVVVDDFLLNTGANLVVDATLGPVEIYGTGDFEMKSNSTVATASDSAVDVSLRLTADNWGEGDDGSSILLNSNGQFTGTIYAPDASLVVESNFEVFGSVVADYIELASNAIVHFDESLLWQDSGAGETIYQAVCWRPLPIE